MNAITFLFYFFEVLAVVSAVSIIFIRNVFYGALLLIVCLLSIAALYVLFNAEFIAVTQILVYAGGILVVIIFGIMLTTRISGKPLVVEHGYKISGGLIGILFSGLLIFFFSSESFSPAMRQPAVMPDNLKVVGLSLMSDFLLPFEIAGVLLLVALLGAIIISSSAKTDKT
jgi:NADH:ubiquinone oxidoreductase subunit 6 (subunit J)